MSAAFWDASAVVYLCAPGQASSRARALYREYPPVIWWGTRFEVRSAIRRTWRDGVLSDTGYKAAETRINALMAAWGEVLPDDKVGNLALDVLDRFPLKAPDALQLAAALAWTKERPRGRLFVSCDTRLSAAAREAGFEIASI